jgi:hypothetical protein
MSPSSERALLGPSVEARVQLDRVELLCVPTEPIPGCQGGLVQDGVPVVVTPSRRTDPDVTHSSPIAAFYPPSHAGGGLPTSTPSPLPTGRPPVAASRPPVTSTPRSRLPPCRRWKPNRLNVRAVRARKPAPAPRRAEHPRRARRGAAERLSLAAPGARQPVGLRTLERRAERSTKEIARRRRPDGSPVAASSPPGRHGGSDWRRCHWPRRR